MNEQNGGPPSPLFPDGWYWFRREKGEWQGVPYQADDFIMPVVGERVNGGKGVRVMEFLLPPNSWMTRRVWVLTEEQRGAVLSHVEQTIVAIQMFEGEGVTTEFLDRLTQAKEALE